MEPEYPVKTHGLVISIGQIKNFLGLAQTFQAFVEILYIYLRFSNKHFEQYKFI